MEVVRYWGARRRKEISKDHLQSYECYTQPTRLWMKILMMGQRIVADTSSVADITMVKLGQF